MIKHSHVGVYGVIIENDSILLIKKARGAYTGSYDLPGGKIEFGETPNEALLREIDEETGLKVKNAEIFDGHANHITWDRQDGETEELHHLGFIYKVNVDINENIKTEADGEDSLGAKWIKLSEINDYELSPFVKKVLNRINMEK